MDHPLLYTGCIDEVNPHLIHVLVDTDEGLQRWDIPRSKLLPEQAPYVEPGDPIDIHEGTTRLHFNVRPRRIDQAHLTLAERTQLRKQEAPS